jgi:mxaJ protein
MSFRCLSLVLIAVLPCMAAEQRVLRVCADPNNMPFSNGRSEGFENKLAEMIAGKLQAKLEYTWWSERKSFIRNSLDQGRCEVVMGVPATLESITATNPYYRSTYVFVSRHDRKLQITSLNDPRFENWRIGTHVVGDDYAPPAYALARRGITSNLTAFSLFGPYGDPNPPAKIIDAVSDGEVDVAIVWGPFAGFFAKTAKAPLDVVPVSPAVLLGVPFTYDISLGVRKGNAALKTELDRVLESQSVTVQQILSEYGVPQVN